MPIRNYHQIIMENSTVTEFTLDKEERLTLHKLNGRLAF
jgi:hypothetical protein